MTYLTGGLLKSKAATDFVDIVCVNLRINQSVDAVETVDEFHRFTVGRDVDEIGDVTEVQGRTLHARARTTLQSIAEVGIKTDTSHAQTTVFTRKIKQIRSQ